MKLISNIAIIIYIIILNNSYEDIKVDKIKVKDFLNELTPDFIDKINKFSQSLDGDLDIFSGNDTNTCLMF